MYKIVGAFDIETDTSEGFGLEPLKGKITEIAVATRTDEHVFVSANESEMIVRFNNWLMCLPVGEVATWGGARFDIPFIWTRAQILGIDLDWSLVPAGPVVKYTPTAPHDGQYEVKFHGRLDHFDIEPLYKNFAQTSSVDWKLKPVSVAKGMSPIEVDRANLHLLSPAEREAYAASDARVTYDLAVDYIN